ncbi:MAG: tRNA-modifying protein YgfZ [Sphingomonadales bacterium]|nr:tRNA-modifying protein YgfZ [Sphingomonadales bacterium]
MARLTFLGNIWQVPVMKAALLPDRGVVKVAGPDARKFLNGLVTADMGRVTPAKPCFAALLTPQGKMIVDFIIADSDAPSGDDFHLDCPRALAPALVERLGFYKLRAKVVVEDVSDNVIVTAIWDGAAPARWGLDYPDPRLPELGLRCISPPRPADAAAAFGAALVDAAAYETHRIALGVPAGGLDFVYGDAFPHEADMDQLHGIDFQKGCFVGQEVVSRMEHRGSARTRVVPVAFGGAAPAAGTAVTAAGKPVGVMGSAAAGRGLASLRLDRVDEALAGGAALTAGGVELRLVKPAWARFAFPGDGAPAPKAAQ